MFTLAFLKRAFIFLLYRSPGSKFKPISVVEEPAEAAQPPRSSPPTIFTAYRTYKRRGRQQIVTMSDGDTNDIPKAAKELITRLYYDCMKSKKNQTAKTNGMLINFCCRLVFSLSRRSNQTWGARSIFGFTHFADNFVINRMNDWFN